MLDNVETRALLRSQGLCHRLCRAVEAVLEMCKVQGQENTAAAFGVLVLVYLVFEDGTRLNVEFLSSRPLIALTMHVITEGCASIVRTLPGFASLVRSDTGAGTSRITSSATVSSRGPLIAPKNLLDELQPFLRTPMPTTTTTATTTMTSMASLSLITPARLLPARSFAGIVAPTDLGLYLLVRICMLTEGGVSAETESSAERSSSASADAHIAPKDKLSGGETSEMDLMTHSTTARNALRSAADGRGLELLVLIAADAARALGTMATTPLPPAASAALLASVRDSVTAAALVHGIAPRFTHSLARLRIVLAVLEDASFLSDENTSELAVSSVPLNVCMPDSSSGGGASASVSATRRSFIAVLLSIVDWSTAWLRSTELSASYRDANVSAVTDDPVMDILHAALRVLMNLTNNVSAGCAAVIAAQPIATHAIAARDWGIAVVVRVAVDFHSPRALIQRGKGTIPSVRVRREVVPSVGMTATAATTAGVSASHFDALVLSAGFLANCIELDPGARIALRRIIVSASDITQVPPSVTRLDCGGLTAVDFFCWLFASRFARMHELGGGAAGGGDATFEAEDVVLSAYIALLLGVCAREEQSSDIHVLASLGVMLRLIDNDSASSSSSSSSSTESPTVVGARALSFALRAFVAVQTSAGVLTEEALGHVTSVQETLDLALTNTESSEINTGLAPTTTSSSARGAKWLEAWLE